MSVTPAQWRRTVHSKNYIIRKARQHDPGLRSTEGCGAADSLCNGRDPLHGRHQQILQPRRFQSILRRTVPKPATPHSPSKLLRRWVSLLDAVYGARHWPGSLVHAPETLFYAHLVPLFCDVGIWPLCPGTVAVRKRDDSDHPDGRFLPNSARAQVVVYPLSAGLTIPPHDGEPAPVVLQARCLGGCLRPLIPAGFWNKKLGVLGALVRCSPSCSGHDHGWVPYAGISAMAGNFTFR